MEDTAIATEKPKIRRPGTNAKPQSVEAALIPDAWLTLATAATVSGLSTPTLYRKAKTDPSFPRLVRLGARCTRVKAGELFAWLDKQAAMGAA